MDALKRIPQNYAIFDDKGLLFENLGNEETLTAYAYLKNTQALEKDIPAAEFQEIKRKYHKPVTGTMYLVKVMDSHEQTDEAN